MPRLFLGKVPRALPLHAAEIGVYDHQPIGDALLGAEPRKAVEHRLGVFPHAAVGEDPIVACQVRVHVHRFLGFGPGL